MMNHRSTLAAAALAVVGMLAAGCADAEPSSAPPSEPSQPAASSSAPPSTSSESAESEEATVDHSTDEDAEPPTLADGVEVPEGVDLDSISVAPGHPPLTEDDLAPLVSDNEVTVECDDPEMQAANEGHEPAGWPAGVAEGEALPDPECHPDFIEVDSWDLYDEFSACCEGVETSTLVDTGMSEQERYRALWDQSQARADWSP